MIDLLHTVFSNGELISARILDRFNKCFNNCLSHYHSCKAISTQPLNKLYIKKPKKILTFKNQ